MTSLALVGIVLILVVLVWVAAQVWPRRPADSLIREHLLDRYVVTINHGETFSGLLAQVDDQTVVLRDVRVTSSNDAPVDGELILRRDSIAYMQKP